MRSLEKSNEVGEKGPGGGLIQKWDYNWKIYRGDSNTLLIYRFQS